MSARGRKAPRRLAPQHDIAVNDQLGWEARYAQMLEERTAVAQQSTILSGIPRKMDAVAALKGLQQQNSHLGRSPAPTTKSVTTPPSQVSIDWTSANSVESQAQPIAINFCYLEKLALSVRQIGQGSSTCHASRLWNEPLARSVSQQVVKPALKPPCTPYRSTVGTSMSPSSAQSSLDHSQRIARTPHNYAACSTHTLPGTPACDPRQASPGGASASASSALTPQALERIPDREVSPAQAVSQSSEVNTGDLPYIDPDKLLRSIMAQ